MRRLQLVNRNGLPGLAYTQAMSATAEAFLDAFHDAHPGCTSRAFGQAEGGLTGYERLAVAVPDGVASLLDVGCGDGFLLAALAKGHPQAKLVGLDRSAGELAVARARLKGTSVALFQGSAAALPFPDASFEVVVSHMALMLMDQLPQVLAEVKRVLVPGGRLLAVVGGPSPKSPAREAFKQAWASLGPIPDPHPPLGESSLSEGAAAWLRLLEWADFETPRVSSFVLDYRRSPEALWQLWADTYTVGALSPELQAKAKAHYVAALQGEGDAKGQVHLPWGLRWLSAKA